MNIQSLQADLAKHLLVDSEEEFMGRLTGEALKIALRHQAAFTTDSAQRYQQMGHRGSGFKLMVFNAARSGKRISVMKALELVITPKLLNGFKTRFGDSASALRSQVGGRVQKMLAKMKQAKPDLSEFPALQKDTKLEVPPQYARALPPLLNAGQVIELSRTIKAERAAATQRSAEIAEEFPGPPEPKTAQFNFTAKMNADKGEKVFRYSRAKSPRSKHKRTART